MSQLSFYRGPTKAERLRLAVRASRGPSFKWQTGMRWQLRDVIDGHIEGGRLIEGATPPRNAFPDLFDRKTLAMLRRSVGLSDEATVDELVDELCNVRISGPTPGYDAKDSLKRKIQGFRRQRPKAGASEIRRHFGLTVSELWDAMRWATPSELV